MKELNWKYAQSVPSTGKHHRDGPQFQEKLHRQQLPLQPVQKDPGETPLIIWMEKLLLIIISPRHAMYSHLEKDINEMPEMDLKSQEEEEEEDFD